jgi:hypothetical protein
MKDIENYDWNRLQGLGFAEKATGDLKDACWKGYTAIGMKKKGGKSVPNCVPLDSKHREGDVATAEMTPNYLPKEPIPGGGDLKNPQMSEGVPIRMPRMEVIKKAASKNGQLAMHASANEGNDFHEHDAFHSNETNAAMIITQLRVIREKADIMLGMLYPDDNLEPWCATKIANAGVAMASVADYLRFGGET